MNRFAEHYNELVSDATQQSLDNEYWVNLFGTNPNNNPTWNINDPVTMEEIRNIVLDMKNNKAPGPDGIPINFFKAFLSKSDLSDNQDDSSVVHYSNCTKCLLSLFNKIWDGDFPEEWNSASIISIPKKRDLSYCYNYRISLINVGLKIISKIGTNRIAKYAFEHKFVRLEQFGFRNKEEFISLYISVRKICQRRKFQGNFTYLAFLDLKKAYNSTYLKYFD